MICIHHNDLDGKCAAAIVNKFFNGPARFIEADYKDAFDFSQVAPGERVYIVDFSIKPPVMEELKKRTHNIIWIDHHATARDYPYKHLDGLRDFEDKGSSGCELTWQYCYPSALFTPIAVKLIGDYDSWKLLHQPMCFQFYEGMKLQDNEPLSPLWLELFGEFGMEKCADIIEHGKTAIKYRDSYCEGVRKAFGYETELDGYKMYATNFYMFGSKGFGEKFDQYDACLAYIHDGKKFTVSLYSEKIDVSIIAKRQGGGGHKGAAGFVCEKLPWIKL